MGCSCVYIDHDCGEIAEDVEICERVAKRVIHCFECGDGIQPGEKYTREEGHFDGTPFHHIMCDDCLSVRDYLFCGFTYFQLWGDLWGEIEGGGGFSEDLISKLTPRAKQQVIELMDGVWARWDE